MVSRDQITRIVWILIIVIVPIISLRNLIFGQGIYSYSDQNFPLTTTLPPNLVVSLSPLQGFSFDRIIVDWPYFLISFFTESMRIREAGLFYYLFLLYSLLCYAFSSLAVGFFSSSFKELSPLKSDAGKLIIFIVAYSNLVAINSNSNGVVSSIILITISISIILILKDKGNFRTYLLISGFMLISALLNPDYFPEFLIAVLFVSIGSSVIYRKWKITVNSIVSIIISLFSLFYLYVQTLVVNPISSLGFRALGYRDYLSSAQVASLFHNVNFFNVIDLFGQTWSTIAFSSPSVLFIKDVYYLHFLYEPAQVLITPGPVYWIWIASVTFIPAISFSALVFKTTRKASIPVILAFLVTYLMIQQWNIRELYYILRNLVYIPVLGDAIGTSLINASQFINLEGFLYLPLFSFGLLVILHFSDRLEFLKRKGKSEATPNNRHEFQPIGKRKSRLTKAVIVIVVLIVTLAGWQAFAYYPMRAYPGFFKVGNAVEPKGVFSTTEINESVLAAYDLVTSNYSAGYNTLWIGGPSVTMFAWEPPPDNTDLSDFSHLVNNNLTIDVLPYLEAHSVRFVVISNQDIQQTVRNPFSSYEFKGYNQALTFFAETQLKKVYSSWGVTVFEVPSVRNSVYYSNILLNDSSVGPLSPSIYEFFKVLGLNASLSPNGTELGLNNQSSEIDFIPPSLLSTSNVTSVKPIFLGGQVSSSPSILYSNSSSFQWNSSLYLNNSQHLTNAKLPGNFTVSEWKGNTTFFFSDGTISATSRNSTFSISYNGSLAGNKGGIYNRDTSSIIGERVTFSASGKDFNGTPSLIILGENRTFSNVFYENLRFNVSNQSSVYELNAIFPKGTAYLGFRIQVAGFSGSFKVGFVNLTIFKGAFDLASSPLGQAINVSNVIISLPSAFSRGYFIYLNDGKDPDFNILSISNGERIEFNGTILGAILTKYPLTSYVSSRAVVNEPVLKSYLVMDGGKRLSDYTLGANGSYIFSIKNGSTLVLNIDDNKLLGVDFFYLIVVLLIGILILQYLTWVKIVDVERLNLLKLRK